MVIKKFEHIKTAEKTVTWLVGIVLTLYIGIVLLLNIPYCQRRLSSMISNELTKLFDTEVIIGNVNPGFLNRLIVDDVLLKDKQGENMLIISRMSVKFDIVPLLKGKIVANSAQLFGFTARLNKATPASESNFQFVIDKLSSEDKTKDSNLDLRINSLLIRRGNVSYDVLSEETSSKKIDLNHLQIKDFRANVTLKALKKDSINASVRSLNFEEANSGLIVSGLNFRLSGNTRHSELTSFSLKLPHSELSTDTVSFDYDGFDDGKDFLERANMHVHLKPSVIALSDISAFVPALSNFKDTINVELLADGSINALNISSLDVKGDDIRLSGKGNVKGLTDNSKPYLDIMLSEAFTNQSGLNFIFKNLSDKNIDTPNMAKNLGDISFKGTLKGFTNDLTAKGSLETDLGTVDADLSINSDNGLLRYKGNIQTIDFLLGKLIGNDDIGTISLNTEINGKRNKSSDFPIVTIKGSVDSLSYKDYTYHDILLDGESNNGGFDGKMTLDDKNLRLVFNGSFNTNRHVPTFNFNCFIDNFQPNNLNLSKSYDGCSLSMSVDADFKGGNIDEMEGEVSIGKLNFITPERTYNLDRIVELSAQKTGDGNDNKRKLTLRSELIDANISGNYSYKTLPASLFNVLRRYIPTIANSQKETETDNNFTFNVDIHNTDLLSAITQIPLNIKTNSTIKGFFNDKARKMRIEGFFPRFDYDGKHIESAVLLCDYSGNDIHTSLRFNNKKASGSMNVSAEAIARNDSLNATINWGNNSKETFSGKISSLISFVKDENAKEQNSFKTVVDINPTNVIVNDTTWNIHKSRVTIENKNIFFDNFLFSKKDNHLQINGTVSDNAEDTLFIDMNNINIRYVFDIADLGISFDGEATGKSYATEILSNPFLNSDLHISNFGSQDSIIGDMDVHGEWHNDKKGLWLDADIKEGEIARTLVDGYIYPIKPTSSLDLNIKSDSTNIGFLQYFLKNLTPDFRGRVSGDVHLYGKFKALTLDGDVNALASIKMDALNTTYTLRDSVRVRPEGLFFTNRKVYDEKGRQGIMNGEITYNHFSDVRYDLLIDANNMLVLNTTQSVDYPFFGTVYGTGNVRLHGNEDEGMNINMTLTTNRNSEFTYIKDGTTTATTNKFVTFNDKTPKRAILDSIPTLDDFVQTKDKIKKDDQGQDVHLNILADITPDITIKIVMDPITGDYITSRGTANVRADWYNKGAFTLFGNYRMSQGSYKMSIQEIIRKDFVIQDGSMITFAGNPFDANLELYTKCQVNSVSLNDLIPNANSYIDQTTVRVDCKMDMTGNLTSPILSLGLDLPLESDEIQALINNYIPTEEQMNMQILYLLSIGKFYTPEYVNVAQNSNMMSSVVSSTLSGQLNNALSAIINSNDWNFGTNFSTGQNGWTDMEFEGMLSGRLLNNRLLINGNFGYRDNQMSNTNFVGDFDAQWLITHSGDIRIKAYNETNDKYLTRTNLTTQGIGVIFKKDFDSWKELMFWNKLRRNKRNKQVQNSYDTTPADSSQSIKPQAQTKREAAGGFVTVREAK